MKKITLLLIPLFLSFVLITFGQNESERQRIIQNSNTKALKQLGEFYQNKSITDKKKAIEFAQKKGLQIFKTFPDGRIAELQRINPDGTPIYYLTQSNLGAANTTKASRLWTGGSMGLNLNGQGMIVGEWDGGPIRLTHQEFGTRAIQQDGVAFTTSDLNNRHATHVGGTMVASGVDGNAKGMAHQATLWANEWNNDTAEMTNQASLGLILSNHSYGYNAAFLPTWMFGFYDSEAQAWDQIATNAPFYLIVKAAGNDRNDGYDPGGVFGTTGYNLVTGSATAKNVLVVGAVNAVSNYTGPASVVMSGFSSWGSTDDGRIKPDVVGNGVSIYSTTSTGNTNYETMSGTSMASPNVTGTLTLIQQHYKNLNSGSFMRAATLRGLVIHTAEEAGANPGPDYAFGWGLVNAEKAVNAITNRGASSIIEERTLNNSTSYSFNVTAISSSTPLEVTIAWNDPAATPLADGTTNSTQSMLVNDLDLRVTEGANTFSPWVLNPANPTAAATQADNARDNVEKVIISNPIPGATYTITINHKGTLQGSNPQNYSIIATGVTTNFNAIFADFTMSRTSVCIGQTITFTDASTKLPSAANISSWTWNFDGTSVGGATPTTATTQGPHTITFNQSGTYQISLTVGNGSTTNTKTQTITVRPVSNLPLTEDFENSPVVGWTATNSGGTFNWGVSSTVGQASTRSATMDLFNNDIETNALFLNAPAINLQGYASVNFSFQLAYTGYDPSNPVYATLEIQASTDCGQTYSTVWTKTGTALATTTPTSRIGDFTAPAANEWRQETFNLNSLIGNSSVLLRFRLTDNFSNRIYVDNVNITGSLAPPTIPTAPTLLTTTAISSSQINLAWTDNANNETAYKVERSHDGVNGWTEIAGNLPANTTSYSDNGLTANTTYHYRVRASNTGGNSAYSNVANATTFPNPPADPSSLTATAVSSSQINLAWTDNANNETAYKVERSPDGVNGWTEIAGSLPANTTSYSDNGLTANTTYHYRVRASNTGGNSAYSNIANATTFPNAPADPSTLTATAISSSQINLAWTDNANNETAYKVERSPDGVNGWTEIAGALSANTTSYSDNGLTANTTYHYRVRASNVGGNSAYSNVANATTFPNPPADPSTLTATAVSSSQINLAWTDNANNETAYKVERSPDGVNGWTEIAGSLSVNTTSYSDNGLTANTTYHYRVRASNAGGNSAYSNIANATTLSAAPSTPTTLAATAVSSSQINLSWTDNANNETAYKVERSPDGVNGWTEIAGSLPANTTSYSDNGLTANTTYHYRVRAGNAGGNSAYSNIANATTLSNTPSVPTAPTTLTATAVSTSQINLSWTDNANNETAYKVERSPDGVNGWTEIAGALPANTTTYSDNGLTANTTYHYRVRASNTGGNSAYSNVANAKTQEEATTAINSELDKAISVSPNPTQNHIQINLTKVNTSKAQIIIYNSIGVVVKSFNSTDKLIPLTLDEYSKGVYYIYITTDSGTSLKKIVLN